MNTRKSTINKQNFLIDVLSLNHNLFTIVNFKQLSILFMSVINHNRLPLKLTSFSVLSINHVKTTLFKNWLKKPNKNTNSLKQSTQWHYVFYQWYRTSAHGLNSEKIKINNNQKNSIIVKRLPKELIYDG